MTAQADGALHVSFQRDPDAIRRHPQPGQRIHRLPRQRLRAADERLSRLPVDLRRADRRHHAADAAAVSTGRGMNSQMHMHIETCPPAVQIGFVHDVVHTARAVAHNDFSEIRAPVQHLVDQPAQRRQADRTGNENQVGADNFVDRPGPSERAANADDGANPQLLHRIGHRPDGADRVHQRIGFPAIAADRDRDFPNPELIHHVELARPVMKRLPVQRLQVPGVDARYLPDHLGDPERHRHHRIAGKRIGRSNRVHAISPSAGDAKPARSPTRQSATACPPIAAP